MMNNQVLGIDISKVKFNVCLLKSNEKPKHKVFANNEQGFKQLLEWLIKHNAEDGHACLEATGTYGARTRIVFAASKL
jgi:transposase